MTDRGAAPAALLFTIFTPTYNRAHTLHRAFEGLAAQTLRGAENDAHLDFEGRLLALSRIHDRLSF